MNVRHPRAFLLSCDDFERLILISILCLISVQHYVKSFRIRSYSGPHFSTFRLNTKRYGEPLRIQSECGKMRTRITPKTDTFHAVQPSKIPETLKLSNNLNIFKHNLKKYFLKELKNSKNSF